MMPPRDPVGAPKTGTAVIRGRVMAADTGQPLRRARIRVTAPELSEARSSSTGADGRYEVKDLPAGRYTVSVSRSGYLGLSYGQKRPFEMGKPLQVAEGAAVTGIDFTLPRMSVISGRVVDEAGEPLPGVHVFAVRSLFFEGRRQLVPVSGGFNSTTDDTGQYRILGLTPGAYYVMGDTRETWTVNEGGEDRVMGYMPTYYPGLVDPRSARRVRVGVGQEVNGIDFNVIPGRAVDVAGVAFDSRGRPLVGREVSMGLEFRGPFSSSYSTVGSVRIEADGAFRFKNVSPGNYVVRVMTTYDEGDKTVEESAYLPLTIEGVGIENLSLTTSAGWSLNGRVVIDPDSTGTMPRDKITIAPQHVGTVDSMRRHWSAGNGRLRDDGTFLFTGVPGAARIRVAAPDGWGVKSILHGGRDVLNEVFELRSGETLSDVEVIVTDRITTVAGVLTDAKGRVSAEGTVLVFPAQPERWTDDFLHVRAVRPDQQGRYEIRGLPPGDYLAVALDYVEQHTWNDPDHLESIRQYARPFSLAEAQSADVPLKLVTPSQ